MQVTTFIQRHFRYLLLIILCLISVNAVAQAYGKDPQDPYENFNRHAYRLNDAIDRNVLKPIATAYKKVLPKPVTKAIGSFFSNLGLIPTIINDLLQTEFYDATSDTWRLLVNSTVGIFGFFDVASHIGLEKNTQDFGLTLATWGYNASAYLVLPFFGPSTVRDAIGMPFDYQLFSVYPHIDPKTDRYSVVALNIINQRANLLNFDQAIKQASFDPYVFQRNAYLQRRAYLIEQNNGEEEDSRQQAGSMINK